MADTDEAAKPAPGGWVVLKFGGTSVSSLERWQTIRSVIRHRLEEGLRPLVVCSALSQVSNQLEKLLLESSEGKDPQAAIDTLRATHFKLADELGIDIRDAVEPSFDELLRTLQGIALTREVTPRLRARILSNGEILATRIGAAWLQEQGVRAVWQDARDLLEARREPPSEVSDERQYLAAGCSHETDPALRERLEGLDAEAVVTQGFIARGPEGDTVLLGRGGSDTSAAYLAARLGAARLEIWTDVPGMFTANPQRVRDARLLRRLGYHEAGELASRGAKVLHPRCLRPVRKHGIPLHVRCTPYPKVEGTVIAELPDPVRPGVRGVASRSGIVLVNMDLEGAWQRVGVIADVATCFKTLGLSIDMLSSSQTHVTIALDPEANHLGPGVLAGLVRALSEQGEPRIDSPAAAVSLVGTSIADVLHELGPLLRDFEHASVHFVSHAANDLSLTLVVDQEASDGLVQALHAKLFGGERSTDPALGPTWDELRRRGEESNARAE